MQPYPVALEGQMQRYYHSLSEKDRRRYAAIEAVKVRYGGQAYIRRLFGCHHQTLALAMAELETKRHSNRNGFAEWEGGRKSAFEMIGRRSIFGRFGAAYGWFADR